MHFAPFSRFCELAPLLNSQPSTEVGFRILQSKRESDWRQFFVVKKDTYIVYEFDLCCFALALFGQCLSLNFSCEILPNTT